MNVERKRLCRKPVFVKRWLPLLLWIAYLGESHATWDQLDDPFRVMPHTYASEMAAIKDQMTLDCQKEFDTHLPLNLTRTIELALCRSPQIKSSWADIQFQASALGAAKGAYLPTLSVSTAKVTSKTRYEGDIPPAKNSGQTVQGALSWRILDFGVRSANLESASHQLRAAFFSHEAALQKLLTSVVGLYFDALSQATVADARQQAMALSRKTTESVERRWKNRVASQGDMLQAQTALLKAQLLHQRAQGEEAKAIAELLNALDLPAASQLKLETREIEGLLMPVADISELLLDIDENHPRILAAKAQLQAANSNVSAALKERLPTVDFTANFNRNGYPNQGLQSQKYDTSTAAVNLTIPLFDGFSRTHKAKGAQAQVEKKEAIVAEVQRQLVTELIKAHTDAVVAKRNLAVATDLQNTIETSMISAERRYANGVADLQELLSHQAALAEARQEKLRAQAELRSAEFRLLSTTEVVPLSLLQGHLSAPKRQTPLILKLLRHLPL